MVVEDEAPTGGVVGFGSTVVVRNEDGSEKTWQIVSSRDAAPGEGRVSAESPMATALMGAPAAIRSRCRCPGGRAR